MQQMISSWKKQVKIKKSRSSQKSYINEFGEVVPMTIGLRHQPIRWIRKILVLWRQRRGWSKLWMCECSAGSLQIWELSSSAIFCENVYTFGQTIWNWVDPIHSMAADVWEASETSRNAPRFWYLRILEGHDFHAEVLDGIWKWCNYLFHSLLPEIHFWGHVNLVVL